MSGLILYVRNAWRMLRRVVTELLDFAKFIVDVPGGVIVGLFSIGAVISINYALWTGKTISAEYSKIYLGVITAYAATNISKHHAKAPSKDKDGDGVPDDDLEDVVEPVVKPSLAAQLKEGKREGIILRFLRWTKTVISAMRSRMR